MTSPKMLLNDSEMGRKEKEKKKKGKDSKATREEDLALSFSGL